MLSSHFSRARKAGILLGGDGGRLMRIRGADNESESDDSDSDSDVESDKCAEGISTKDSGGAQAGRPSEGDHAASPFSFKFSVTVDGFADSELEAAEAEREAATTRKDDASSPADNATLPADGEGANAARNRKKKERLRQKKIKARAAAAAGSTVSPPSPTLLPLTPPPRCSTIPPPSTPTPQISIIPSSRAPPLHRSKISPPRTLPPRRSPPPPPPAPPGFGFVAVNAARAMVNRRAMSIRAAQNAEGFGAVGERSTVPSPDTGAVGDGVVAEVGRVESAGAFSFGFAFDDMSLGG
mmetsp:Transcript_15900/g.31679  ORF Transcript_15900/g.31679 Transcript_15900/m.31679 type:complete len:297 (-) Transcript_15900:173-1063(-)